MKSKNKQAKHMQTSISSTAMNDKQRYTQSAHKIWGNHIRVRFSLVTYLAN